MNFYLTINTNRNEPVCLRAVTYVHVKARTDGERTLVITEAPVDDEAMTPLAVEDAQAVLDSWAKIENDDEENPDIVHTSVNVTVFDNPTIWEQAKMNRIARGFFTAEEAATFATIQAMRDAFPRVTQGFTAVEAEILFEKMARVVGG